MICFPARTRTSTRRLAQLFDVDLDKLDDLPERSTGCSRKSRPITHLTKDDAPAALIYASEMDTPITSQVHRHPPPRFGKALKEKMDDLGHSVRSLCRAMSTGRRVASSTMDFVKEAFGMK